MTSTGPTRPTPSTDVRAPQGFDPWPSAQVHVEWGLPGARLAAARGDIVVVVDVLSFSTTLTIAVERGSTCFVYSADELDAMGGRESAAKAFRAVPLSSTRRVRPGVVSLSPSSVRLAPPGQRLLVTSLNGAAVVAAAMRSPAVLLGCLRNAGACAARVGELLSQGVARRVTVVPCGEQWSSVSPEAAGPRPALEDWLGAGVLCDRLRSGFRLSAEASCAAAAWSAVDATPLLASSVSARELLAAGFAGDVALALELDVTDVVPRLGSTSRAFTAD